MDRRRTQSICSVRMYVRYTIDEQNSHVLVAAAVRCGCAGGGDDDGQIGFRSVNEPIDRTTF